MSDERKIYAFPGKEVEVSWDGPLCIHVGECTRAGQLFVSGRKPWCQPDLGTVEEVTDVARRCPTGSLTYTRKDGGPTEIHDSVNTVVVSNNGPLYARGRLSIEGAPKESPGLQFRAALCRCGESLNKPFCDNTHEKQQFQDRGAIGTEGDTALEAAGGCLKVKTAPDGPLLVSGNFTLRTGSGRQAWKGTKAALCRCGASKNKPFCDGAHVAAGFKAG
jgi:CDGSH-type Zn-finger protein/uncharacterized Fe-S cluster protein YjdI